MALRQYIGNDPGFDPAAVSNGYHGQPKGRRFRNLLYVGGGVVVLGAIGIQMWIGGWGGDDEPDAPVISQAKAAVPNYSFDPPPVTPVAEEPAPAPPPPPPKKEAPRRGSGRANAPELPTQVAFAVQVSGTEPDNSWMVDGRRPHLAQGCALRPGLHQLHGTLLTVIESEIGGQAIAQITEDVYDADGYGNLLIPAGSRAIGIYKEGGLDFQSRRLGFLWTEIARPDGTSITLGDAYGMDAAGSMGVGGEVNTRWGELLATAALLTVFDGISRGTVSSDNTLADSMQRSASRTTGRLGEQVTGRVLDWEPDIRIQAGTQIIISPSRTIQVC